MGAVFLGTPAPAIPSLYALADIADVDLVITQPDRRAGRGAVRQASPVKVAANYSGFPVLQPESAEELARGLEGKDFDFGLVVAYGRILTPDMLATTRYGFLNVHFSLLPRWRGAAPVERAIAAGDARTGVTLMKIDEGLDTGPVLGEIATPIDPSETGGSLTARLAFLGASLVDRTIPEYLAGRRIPVPQIDAGKTHAKRLSKAEAMLDPSWDAVRAERAVRAFNPRPGAWFSTPDGVLRVHAATFTTAYSEPGIIAPSNGEVIAGFEDGALALGVIQPEGKQRMDASAWANGRRGEGTTFVGAS